MTAILGLNAFHPDSSACLAIDGQLIGAVAEERLGSRSKHTMAFPENAIRWLLQDSGLRLRDITHIAIARQPDANFVAKAKYVLFNPSVGLEAVTRFTSRHRGTVKTLDNLAEICNEDPRLVNYKLHTVEHHLAHIASAYYMSPFEKLTAGFSYDGSGDFASAMAARCEGNHIEVLDKVTVPNKIGRAHV